MMKAQYKTIATAFAAAFMAVACSAADTAAAATASGTATAAATKATYMPRSEWHALVSACAQDPAKLKATIAKIAPDEQPDFLAEVNAAIATMPGSDEKKAAAFLAANEAAMFGAKEAAGATAASGKAVLATVYATVPLEYLTVVNEQFAKDVLARGEGTTDASMTSIAKGILTAVIARCQQTENAGVRETFAILTLLRVAGGSPANLQDVLVQMLPDEKTRELASTKWIGPAMATGAEKSYDPMLGAAGAGDEPDHAVVVSLTGSPDVMVSMLADLEADTATAKIGGGAFIAPGSVAGTAPNDGQADIGLNRIPRGAVQQKTDENGDANPYYTERRGSDAGDTTGGGGGGGYNGQVMKSF